MDEETNETTNDKTDEETNEQTNDKVDEQKNGNMDLKENEYTNEIIIKKRMKKRMKHKT